MNVLQKPYDNPKVRQAIAYAINKEALAKVAFGGFACRSRSRLRARSTQARHQDGARSPTTCRRARELLKEARLPQRL